MQIFLIILALFLVSALLGYGAARILPALAALPALGAVAFLAQLHAEAEGRAALGVFMLGLFVLPPILVGLLSGGAAARRRIRNRTE
ncbi:hypothetical protein ACQ5SO_12875 [Rhodovulum sp. DZ06]|uniref:hypothetical protein n=1 Tax=Rhodovulum sp. DZ06 TaxID=3425126 RepID=UPI003D34CA9D